MDSGLMAVKLVLSRASGGYDERDIVLDSSTVYYQMKDSARPPPIQRQQ